MSSACDASRHFPLHLLVWNNDYRQLEKELRGQNVEALDPRGRSLLHLAVSLGHLESARVLLRHKADVTKENREGWTVLHEAVSTGDPEMVYTVLQHRDYHNTTMALEGVPELLRKILEAPDFYVQMKWEFTSWDNWAELMEVNHDDKVVTTEHFDLSQEMERLTLDLMKPKGREVERRLTSPVINTSLDTKNIAFERTKSGFWGWRTDKAEVVNGYEAKVYTVNNVSVITKIRTEHLTEEEKKRYKEIPLFHVLNARITFGNVNGCSTAEENISQNAEGTQLDSASPLTNFEVDQSVFEIPESYHVQDNGRNMHLQDEDYEIMQFAIQQSLLESTRSQELSGPASNGGIGQAHTYDAQYERAIQESLLTSSEGPGASSETSRFDSDLQLAMELSAKELEERELRLQEEEAELQQVLQLSLTEK